MSEMKIAVIHSPYHTQIANGLLWGVKKSLQKEKIKFSQSDIYVAPGAFEIPLLAKTLAQTGKYDGIICLGCVIKGDTAHFEYISEATAHGLMQATLETQVPITFGILTTYTEEQANVRAQTKGKLAEHNKGIEAASACIASVRALRKMQD